MLWKNIKYYKQGLSLPAESKYISFEVDLMSSFQDMTYYYSVIGICLIIVEVKLF